DVDVLCLPQVGRPQEGSGAVTCITSHPARSSFAARCGIVALFFPDLAGVVGSRARYLSRRIKLRGIDRLSRLALEKTRLPALRVIRGHRNVMEHRLFSRERHVVFPTDRQRFDVRMTWVLYSDETGTRHALRRLILVGAKGKLDGLVAFINGTGLVRLVDFDRQRF